MNPAEEYILNQPEPFDSMLLHLQVIIENSLPDVDLKYKYSVPFYYVYGKPFCYLNVPKNKAYVDVGFWNGAYLTVHLEYLTTAKRKVIKSVRYTSLSEIDDQILIEILQDAYLLQGQKFFK